jgi:hypothetical protein
VAVVVVLVGTALAMALLVLLARFRDRVTGVPRHIPAPPEGIHPAVLVYLRSEYFRDWPRKKARQTAYRAQLIHLLQRRIVEISSSSGSMAHGDVRIRRTGDSTDDLDRQFIWFLFGNDEDGVASLRQAMTGGYRRGRLQTWWRDVRYSSPDLMRAIRKGRRRIESILILGVALVPLSFGLSRIEGVEGLAAFGAIGEAYLALRLLPARLPVQLRERVERWKAFRRFLREGSSSPEATPVTPKIRRQHLAYEVALGLAPQIEEQIHALVPTDDLLPPVALPGPPSLGSGWGG